MMKRMSVGQLILLAVLSLDVRPPLFGPSQFGTSQAASDEQARLDRAWPWYLLFPSDRMRINGADVFQ